MAAGTNGAMPIEIDMSDFNDKVMLLELSLSKQKFNQVMHHTVRSVARRVKYINAAAVPKKYVVTSGQVRNETKKERISGGGGNFTGIVPVKGAKHSIGGHYPATGGMPGWSNVGHPYRITAQIVKGTTSTLPAAIGSMGGGAPWRNTSAGKAGMATTVFVRKGPQRDAKIASVKGVSIPQMVENRSHDEIEQKLHDFAGATLDKYIANLL